MSINISRSLGFLGMPIYIHFIPGVSQHMNVSPDHLLIVMIINGASLKEMCTSKRFV